ncbi:metallophosphoesterase family protein [Litoreibacter roseus]|uniref:Bis(5'-nucleosyl)-tetraphosphatase n=1 Tax=Litoreibacter roseus TaxID=2601869 RepID=A0A6N6JBI3_9RHOB|nr:metallophosphoesterase family protein [Litoreibacter roseus]GFE63506.1 bis(5'-nucleosyl)-tetraphosphatase [Litoreibacter roseus]
MSFLKSMMGRKVPVEMLELEMGQPEPDGALFVTGDIHGRIDLLEDILGQIDKVIGEQRYPDPKLIFLGDAIDRGPDSQAVLRRLHALSAEFPDNFICLMGNHEQMLLDFLEDPSARYSRWLRNGGLATCQSFGLDVSAPNIGGDVAEELAVDLEDVMGKALIDWLRARPTKYISGNVAMVHAAVDPSKDIEMQADRVLIWGHPDFLSRSRSDGIWVVHGHTTVEQPSCQDRRVSIDTGAYDSGVLTSAIMFPGEDVSFLTTSVSQSH